MPSTSNQGTPPIIRVKSLPSYQESSHNSHNHVWTKTLMDSKHSLQTIFHGSNNFILESLCWIQTWLSILEIRSNKMLVMHWFKLFFIVLKLCLYTKVIWLPWFNDTFQFVHKNRVISCNIFTKYCIQNKLHLEKLVLVSTWHNYRHLDENIVHPKKSSTKWTHKHANITWHVNEKHTCCK